MKFLIITLTLLLSLTSFAQEKSDRKSRREESKIQIQVLKNTGLLVRLKSYKKQLDHLTDEKYASRKDAIIKHRDEENMEIINAFNNEFDFCPVYFFYNSDTKKIIEKDFKNVFINKDLAKDPNITFALDTFLIGELGYVVTDSTTTYGSTAGYKNGINNADGYAQSATTSSDFSNYGFNIRTQNFILINRPFPRFTSGYFAFVKRSPKTIIKRVNRDLHRYKDKYLN